VAPTHKGEFAPFARSALRASGLFSTYSPGPASAGSPSSAGMTRRTGSLAHPLHTKQMTTLPRLLLAAPRPRLLRGRPAQPVVATTPTLSKAPVDYRQDASWLCRPGRQDPCAVDQRATVVNADGVMVSEEFRANRDAPIDCFYVYPTVSTDPGANSDMTADLAERRVVEQQLARFASQCRLFAPLYRQVTLAALRAGVAARRCRSTANSPTTTSRPPGATTSPGTTAVAASC
jgi:hypothetical protein